MDVKAYIKENEGKRNEAYDDATGKVVPPGGQLFGTLTIGFGHTGTDVMLHSVWSDEQCEDAFEKDFNVAETGAIYAVKQEFWQALGEVRQAVVVDMTFELGLHGLLMFTHFLEALRQQQWQLAANNLKASRLFQEVPRREESNMRMLTTGEW